MRSDFKDFVLDGSPLLSLVIGSHLLAENYLRQILSEKLARPDAVITVQGPSFSALVSWSEAIGLLSPDIACVFRALNSLRNKYAHRIAFEASRAEVDLFLSSLREMKEPFYSSYVPGSERELALAIASFRGCLQRTYGPLKDKSNA